MVLGESLMTGVVCQMKKLVIPVFSILFSSAYAQAQDAKPIDLTPCFIGKISEKGKCATVKVPLDHQGAVEGEIDLFVAIVPALSSQILDDPLVVFAGGPGQAASDMGSFVKIAFESIREHRDIILIDQRGTGKSTPLKCESSGDDDTVYSANALIASVKECRSLYDIPVEYFTMENVVADTHDILKRLGYDKINLWGVSWGTRTAVHYARRHASDVRSIIVDGILPPDVGIFETAPVSAGRALSMLNEACNSDEDCANSYGDIAALIARLIEKADAGELVYSGEDAVTGDPVDTKIDRMSLVQNIRALLYSPQKATMLPMALKRLEDGDGRSFVALIANSALMSKSMYLGSTFSLLCGEEVPRISAESAKALGADYFTGNSYHEFWSTACSAWPSQPGEDDIHTPFVSDIPMVLLSGELDPITPPSMGEHLAKSFINSRQ